MVLLCLAACVMPQSRLRRHRCLWQIPQYDLLGQAPLARDTKSVQAAASRV